MYRKAFFTAAILVAQSAMSAEILPSENLSARFFDKFKGDSSTWSLWVRNYYTSDKPALLDEHIEKSKEIKEILESDYGVYVPFDDARARRMSNPLDPEGAPFPEACSWVTVRLLGSTVSAVLISAKPESNSESLMLPHYDYSQSHKRLRGGELTEKIKESSRDYLDLTYKSFEKYCVSDKEKPLVSALKKFIGRLDGEIQSYAVEETKKNNEIARLERERVSAENYRIAKVKAEEEKARLFALEAERKKADVESKRAVILAENNRRDLEAAEVIKREQERVNNEMKEKEDYCYADDFRKEWKAEAMRLGKEGRSNSEIYKKFYDYVASINLSNDHPSARDLEAMLSGLQEGVASSEPFDANERLADGLELAWCLEGNKK